MELLPYYLKKVKSTESAVEMLENLARCSASMEIPFCPVKAWKRVPLRKLNAMEIIVWVKSGIKLSLYKTLIHTSLL